MRNPYSRSYSLNFNKFIVFRLELGFRKFPGNIAILKFPFLWEYSWLSSLAYSRCCARTRRPLTASCLVQQSNTNVQRRPLQMV